MSDPGAARAIIPFNAAWRAPVLAALLYFAVASVTIALTDAWSAVAPVWPANALLLALLRNRRPSAWWPVLLAGGLANVAANLATRGTFGAPVLFSLANVAEVALAAWALRRNLSEMNRLESRTVWRFLLWGGVIAPMISGLLGAATALVAFGQPFPTAYATWVVADGLGLIVVTPFLVKLFDGSYLRRWRGSTLRQKREAAALYLLTAAVAAAVFQSEELPILFLVGMPLMLVTFRLGWAGANLAVMIVALIGAVGTMNHSGPVAIPAGGFELQASLFQIFLASLLVTCMPVAAAASAQRELMRELQESERSLRLVVSQSPSLLLEFDRSGMCHKAFGARDTLKGLTSADLIGRGFDAVAPRDPGELQAAHDMALSATDELFAVEFRSSRGAEAWYEASFCGLLDEFGRCVGSIASIHDVTERKLQVRALARSAMMDSLTGLFNRAGFLYRLGRALSVGGERRLALAMIDVDRFKLINDNSGHAVGDLVLAEIGRRIAGEVRASDTVGRLGGDEFAVLLEISDGDDAEDVCARIVAAVASRPIALASGGSIGAAISCGLAWHQPDSDAEDFLLAADTALYEAKRGGRNRVVAA
jgi:diguanylate cyclase (GGDEF)-like protein/PAS domain S-box-containing protein